MTIEAVDWYRYGLHLTTPLPLGCTTATERRGLLLRVRLDTGAEGWGDAAPLPGFSTETLDDAINHARRVAPHLSGTPLPDAPVEKGLRALPLDDAPPSIRFAAESAVVEAVAWTRDTSPGSLLGARRDAVALNALVTDDTADLGAEGERVRAAGYEAVKLKVGRRPVEADAARVRTLRRVLGDAVALRLDANRAWTIDEARAFMDALNGTPFAYVEEPLADPADLRSLVDATGCPVALDETTREVAPADLPAYPVRAVVLKPTLLGGLSAARRWGRAADACSATPVVSASYESGVGLRMLAALAAGLSGAPAGLSTYARLATDVLTPRLDLDGPRVAPAPLWTSQVDRSQLAAL